MDDQNLWHAAAELLRQWSEDDDVAIQALVLKAITRLVAENGRLRVVLDQSRLALSNALETGRIACRCYGADECEAHGWLIEIEQALGGLNDA